MSNVILRAHIALGAATLLIGTCALSLAAHLSAAEARDPGAPAETSVQGVQIVGRSGAPDPFLQRWADAATAPTPPSRITVYRQPCPDADGSSCTEEGGPIYLSPTDGREVFLHELGHHFDYAMSDRARQQFLRLAGLAGQAWRRPGMNSPHERFAEAWGLCAAERPRQVWDGRVHGGYAYEPTTAVHDEVCAMIRAEAELQGWTNPATYAAYASGRRSSRTVTYTTAPRWP